MIPLAVITAFLTTIITLFFNSLSDAWKDLRSETKDAYATSIQNFVEEVKKDFSDKPAQRRMKEPNDFEGNQDEVRAWCRRMTLFFQSNNILKEWERIEIALGKIKGGKENRAQRWADAQMKKFLPFQKEWKGTGLNDNGDLDILVMTNKPPFETWEQMANKILHIDRNTNSCDREVDQVKQGNRLLEDYWMEFTT